MTVSSGLPAIQNLTYVRYGDAAGGVTDDRTPGVGLDGVRVQAWQGNSLIAETATAGGGLYDLGLAPGTYTIVFLPFAPPGQSYVTPSSQPGVVVTSTNTTPVPTGVYTRYGVLQGVVSATSGALALNQVQLTVRENNQTVATGSPDPITGRFSFKVPQP